MSRETTEYRSPKTPLYKGTLDPKLIEIAVLFCICAIKLENTKIICWVDKCSPELMKKYGVILNQQMTHGESMKRKKS